MILLQIPNVVVSSDPLEGLKEIGKLIALLGGAGGILKIGFAASRLVNSIVDKMDTLIKSQDELSRNIGDIVRQVAFLTGVSTAQAKRGDAP